MNSCSAFVKFLIKKLMEEIKPGAEEIHEFDYRIKTTLLALFGIFGPSAS